MTKTIKIEGMSCSHCSGAVTKALEALEGVSEVQVSLENKQAVFQLTGAAATDAVLREAIEDAGYDVVGMQ